VFQRFGQAKFSSGGFDFKLKQVFDTILDALKLDARYKI
jgi:hypothetical protein